MFRYLFILFVIIIYPKHAKTTDKPSVLHIHVPGSIGGAYYYISFSPWFALPPTAAATAGVRTIDIE